MDAIAQLYAQIYENPDDDHLRRVLADALMAAGDPRGELILYQLDLEDDGSRRAMRLIQSHGLSWLGRLRGIVIPTAYERGFVASCVVIEENPEPLPEWATVHSIELASDGAFYLHPEMKSLRSLVIGKRAIVLSTLATRSCELLARLDVRITYEQPLETVLAALLSGGVGRSMVVANVPEAREEAMLELARRSRTPMQLEVDRPSVADPQDLYDAADE